MTFEIPGWVLDEENSTPTRAILKKIEEKIKWKDIGAVSGYYVSSTSSVNKYNSTDPGNSDRNTWPTEEEAEASIALSQLLQWRNKYNEGWVADWSPDSYYKWVIFYKNNSILIDNYRGYQRVLSFKSEDIAEKFLKDFADLIEIAKPLL